jgi:hypothetical protein
MGGVIAMKRVMGIDLSVGLAERNSWVGSRMCFVNSEVVN